MFEYNIILPSKPRVVSEDEVEGIYEIDGLAPGYGHTLGNSLRRIILSSLPGVSVTSVKIEGVNHEFSTIEGVKEDIILIILNLRKVRFRMNTGEPQRVTLSIKGPKKVTAADIKVPSQVEVLNKDAYIADVVGKNVALNVELVLEKGLGFVPKEALRKDKVEIGVIALDAVFTPIRRARYEVENMRVGDRTDHNRLRLLIETDGTISPREALEKSIEIMTVQLQAIAGFKTEEKEAAEEKESKAETAGFPGEEAKEAEDYTDVMKTRIDTLNVSARTLNALTAANIRTIGGMARKREEDLLKLKGLGDKGIQEIKRALSNFGIILK